MTPMLASVSVGAETINHRNPPNAKVEKGREMSRHPYTHAADFVRLFMGGSRSDASLLLEEMAQALDMDKEALCEKLSLRFQERPPALQDAEERCVQRIVETVSAS